MAEASAQPPVNAEELLRRYAAGERDFKGADLVGADLASTNLTGANLCDATLVGADLCGATLTGANLCDANLYEANLGGANLKTANLRGADFVGAHLEGANFRGAHLVGANLGSAHLEDATLLGAHLEDAILLGAHLGGADLRAANLEDANLYDANLVGAALVRALLFDAILESANLESANLTGAHLGGAHLGGANLTGANLRGAHLAGANLVGANLRGANLTGANLHDANLTGADLSGADLSGARLWSTLLLNVDLTALCDAGPSVEHLGPSVVDFRTIIKSLRSPTLKLFLHRAGVPDVFVEYMVECARTLDPRGVFKMLQSTFICYGSPDERFARKLYEALHRNGVTTFFFTEHAVPGDKLHRMMRKGVNEHDRVILVCSRESLDRKGVLNEIEETLARESRDGGAAYLIPIRLDDYVFSGWAPPNPDTAQSVRDRVVADFEGAEADQAKFDAGLLKLIAALKK